jgi:hypothetical protein
MQEKHSLNAGVNDKLGRLGLAFMRVFHVSCLNEGEGEVGNWARPIRQELGVADAHSETRHQLDDAAISQNLMHSLGTDA